MSDHPPPPRTTPAKGSGVPRWLAAASVVLLVILVVLDPFVDGHPKFGIDGSFAFYAWYGFGAGLALVAVAKVLGVFLKRRDTYYD